MDDELQQRRRERERRADEAFYDGLLIGTYWQRNGHGVESGQPRDPRSEDRPEMDALDDVDDFGDDVDFFD